MRAWFPLVAGVALCALTSGARASSLTVDGQSSILRTFGNTVTVQLTGAPGQPAYLLIDLFEGPTNAFNQALPLGFSSALFTLPLGNLSAGGTVSFGSTIPSDPTLEGRTIYLLGVVQQSTGSPVFDFSNGASVQISSKPFAKADLAGKSLANYPHFQTVRAINQNEATKVGLDTTRYPFAAGKNAKIFVVAKKTASQWDVDPTLVDVSNDGANSVAFVAGGIQANTFTVDAGTLSANAGTSLGVGYDVVIDLDQNNALSAGDLIDGYSSEAGFYAVHDLTQPGPLAVTETIYSGGTFLGQDLYYPTSIASLGQLPLVVISHGNGHNYQWYDHIGFHLASYGFIVMSHENNTMPGIETASTTTLTNTDYLLANIGTIAGGALVGHLDKTRITWIGHSRGGEGVARAYDRIFDGTYIPSFYTLSDIKLISSMAPTDFLGVNSSNPHDVNYHLWVGGADADVTGCANSDIAQSFHLHDRAGKARQSTSLHGVGHGDFHNSSGSVAMGPCLTGKPTAHLIIKGYFLPLVQHYINGNIPAKDFLTRQWEDLHPIGAPFNNICVNVDLMYRESPDAGKFVIDDFQTQTATTVASSSSTVTASVNNLAEGVLNDLTADFTNVVTDNFNGFTQGGGSDSTRGGLFDFNGVDSFIRYDLPLANRNLSPYVFLSLRACQQTRNPLTTAVVGDLTFSITLRDGFGHSSTINIGSYGGGVEEPYQRTGCGSGVGWGNEFETIRVRLTDFARNGKQIELTNITSVELNFGPSFGSSQGRIGIDDLELTKD